MKTFALLIAVSILLVGCGGNDDDDDQNPQIPRVVRVASGSAKLQGASIPANATIVVEFNMVVKDVEIIIDAPGTVSVTGKTATWVPMGDMPAGNHTLSEIIVDGQPVEISPITFIAVRA